jgi:NAD(P) transhydrogenase subunit alpha
MVEKMRPGAVIVDLAAEKGGNCELTEPGKIVDFRGVKIIGMINPANYFPRDASFLYSKNIANFIRLLLVDGKIVLNFEDEIIRDTAVCHDGKIVSPLVRKVLGES